MANPYHYGTPVTGAQFAGRRAETAALETRMRDGINVLISSPRRYGKTSLLLRATERLRREGAAVVSVNVLSCKDLPTFAARLASEAYRVKGGTWHRVKRGVADFAGRLRVTPTVTFDGDQPRFAFAAGLAPTDADAIIEDVYALLGELSAQRPAVLVLDEFQAVTALGEHLPGLFKSLADAHPTVSLVLAGSHQHLMDTLTADRGAPLYGVAERFALDVLPAATMTTYLRQRAAAYERDLDTAAATRIVELAGPVPNDIQRLAYETWVVSGPVITPADVEEGMRQAVAHEAAAYADTYGSLPAGQRRVLSTLAAAAEGVCEPYAGTFVTAVGLANAASVRRALQALLSSELVVRRDGSYVVLDPFLRAWLQQTL